jgi:hypothetical protein
MLLFFFLLSIDAALLLGPRLTTIPSRTQARSKPDHSVVLVEGHPLQEGVTATRKAGTPYWMYRQLEDQPSTIPFLGCLSMSLSILSVYQQACESLHLACRDATWPRSRPLSLLLNSPP